eukprot:scaffold86433_cov16-Tisochrysis_lutea.AAC.1
MNGRAVTFVHLVKLIYAADALVSQHQRASLQHQLLGQLQAAQGKAKGSSIAASMARGRPLYMEALGSIGAFCLFALLPKLLGAGP